MSDKFILNEHGNPVAEDDLFTWAAWLESADRRVAEDHIKGIRISTVFLGLDHSFGNSSTPVLWETMVFGGWLDQTTDQCGGSREQAEAMHEAMKKRVLEFLA